ncbi:MAG: hypothetical protein KatS3mg110_1410 [Pirellulaceae bacterium]|nr:MAG: hypothetical protein KatS3mg110_1410 [Pirellulaceae bacterium]
MRKICVVGLLNSGKSTLLSVLTRTDGVFPAGARPALTKNVVRWRDGHVEWIDTPALDSGLVPEEQIIQTCATADLVLWCHSVRLGELHRNEINALEKCLANRISPRHIVMVVSHRDGVLRKEIERNVIKAIRSQMRGLLENVLGIARTGETKPGWRWGKLYSLDLYTAFHNPMNRRSRKLIQELRARCVQGSSERMHACVATF